MSCCTVGQGGNDGMTLTFDPANFPKIAQIVQPKRRKPVTEAELAGLKKAGGDPVFTQDHGVETQLSRQGSQVGASSVYLDPQGKVGPN